VNKRKRMIINENEVGRRAYLVFMAFPLPRFPPSLISVPCFDLGFAVLLPPPVSPSSFPRLDFGFGGTLVFDAFPTPVSLSGRRVESQSCWSCFWALVWGILLGSCGSGVSDVGKRQWVGTRGLGEGLMGRMTCSMVFQVQTVTG
jgi:hypothetical protein